MMVLGGASQMRDCAGDEKYDEMCGFKDIV